MVTQGKTPATVGGTTKERAHEDAERIMYLALEKGLNFKIAMGNILTLTPPLTITKEEMDEALDILEECFKENL